MAAEFFHQNLLQGHGLDYAESRGIKRDTITEFKIGFALDQWDALAGYFNSLGISGEDLLKASLVTEKKDKTGYIDYFHNRLIFPIFDYRERVIKYREYQPVMKIINISCFVFFLGH